MSDPTTTASRRRFLHTLGAAALLAGASPLAMTAAHASKRVARAPRTFPPGKPGEFDFLAGQWTIQHRQLQPGGKDAWTEFAGEATCWTILGGVGSVEELRIPARQFSGLGLRLLDVEKHLWSDFWVSGRSGVLSTPGMPGGFEDGVGTFIAEDTENGRPVLYRGVWDRITPTSCRWHQASSRDDGKTWDPNWFMDWTRA